MVRLLEGAWCSSPMSLVEAAIRFLIDPTPALVATDPLPGSCPGPSFLSPISFHPKSWVRSHIVTFSGTLKLVRGPWDSCKEGSRERGTLVASRPSPGFPTGQTPGVPIFTVRGTSTPPPPPHRAEGTIKCESLWEREYNNNYYYSIFPVGDPAFGGVELILWKNQPGWQHELLFSNPSDVPL